MIITVNNCNTTQRQAPGKRGRDGTSGKRREDERNGEEMMSNDDESAEWADEVDIDELIDDDHEYQFDLTHR